MIVTFSAFGCAFLLLLAQYSFVGECSPPGQPMKESEKRELEFFHSHRNRRFSGLIPVRDRIANAICSYEVITDINFQRIPNRIDRVICKTEDCKVIGNADYKCAQLYAQLNVTYPKDNCRLEFEMMNIEYACICARSIGSTHITVIEPVFT